MMRLRKIILLGLICIAHLPIEGLCESISSDDGNQDVALSIGRSVSWPVSAQGSISVSNGSIIRVSDQRHRLQVTALKLGAAVVTSGARHLEVNVIPEPSYRLYASLREAVRGRRGLSISAAEGSLKIVGRLLRAEDWFAIGNALSGYDVGKFSFAASIDPSIEGAIRKELNSRLLAGGVAHVDLRLSPEAVATVGVEPRDARARAEKVLAPFGLRVESNSSVLTLEPLVRVRVLIAEIKKSFTRQFGVTWENSIGGSLIPEKLFPTGLLNFNLKAAESSGWGRILASPNLLCRSGKEAQFMAGGEFPIKTSSFRSSDVIWKSYGIILRVKPVADLAGRMSIEIETEVSEIDKAHSTGDGVPGLLTNRMQTHFDLTRSRTIALSGLIKSGLSNGSNGLPGLSSIPILGPLFSSRDFQDERSELVVFVTPEVMKPDDEALEKKP